MLCIYVEYCVTSRAGKCLETCNTDKPRFDDFTGHGLYASVQLPLPALFRLCYPSEIPLARPTPRSKFSEQTNSTDAPVSSWNSTNFRRRSRRDHFTSTTCFWRTLEITCCKDIQLLFKWKLHFQCDLR